MKKAILLSLTVPLIILSTAKGKVRDLKPIGEQALRKGMISQPPKDHDFTTIAPDASYRAGEVLVRFAPKANGAEQSKVENNAALAAIGGGNIKRSFGLVPGLAQVILPKDLTVEQALKIFNDRSEILYAEPDYEVQIVATPNDTNFSDLWGMHNTGQTGGTADADIDAPEAWDISTDANEIVVAVIDTGINYTHPDLADNMWVNQTELGGTPEVDDDNNGYVDDIYGYDFCTYGQSRDSDPNDDHYHGTHCAGTIGAVGNNNQGVVGVCWKVKIMALKFMGPTGTGGADGYVSDAIDAIEYAVAMDANLSSNSWGGDCYSQSLKNAIESAGTAGLLFVAAAGNSYDDSDSYPVYPAAYDCNSIISVLATCHEDMIPCWSNYGLTSVDLGAPGNAILSTFPTYMTSSMSTRGYSTDYETISGTSMAAPHVAGACALMWSENLTLTNSQIKDLVLRTVDRTLPGKCVSEGRLNIHSALLNRGVHNTTQRIWYETIQDALDDANDLDVIRVHPGTYYENVDFNGVSCTLTSTDPNDPNVAAATIIDANDSGSVVTLDSGEDANAVLAGLTITGGNTPGLGAGVHCSNASPTISKCVITDNDGRYGGGVYSYDSSPTILNSTLTENSASYYGGGIYNEESDPNVINCTFSGNSAQYGGGMFTRINSTITVANCIFSKNNATGAGGMFNLFGSNATVTNCVFHDNEAELYGGGMANISSSPQITNCLFTHNSVAGTTGGGGMFNTSCAPTLTNCTFSQNDANSDGGAMLNWLSALPTVVNCVFWGNDAAGSGDEIHNEYSNSEPNFSYCDIEGCGAPNDWDPNLGNDDGNNIDQDPCFVDPNDPNGPDDVWCTADDGLALDTDSPCMDTGNDSAVPNDVNTDIKGDYRIMGDAVDMGAYEFLQYDIYYVDVNGDDSNGTSWAHAFNDINSAVEASRAGDEIWVAKGTYVLTSEINVDKPVRIYGGFDATETQRSQRDSESNVTTVDGNDSVRCFYVSADCTVDGFTITKGHAHVSGGTYIDNQGAGMYLHYCDPNIANCTFSDNESHDNGGGMHNRGSSPTITNCTFSNNECGDEGGAIRNRDASSPVLTDCTFSNNSAPDKGGGISNHINCHPTLTNCVFTGNSANSYGGGMHCSGNSDPVLTNCTFKLNTAKDGGGMYNYNYCQPTLVDCNFIGNAASYDGGGMYSRDSDPMLVNCLFHDNNSVDHGGAMYNKQGCSPTLINCVLAENEAGDDGGAVYNDEVCCPTFINCTFFDNEADDDGGAMYNDESDPCIANCILFYNDAPGPDDEIKNSSSNPCISHSDIDDCGGSGVGWDPNFGTDCGGNIDESPNFYDDDDLDGPDDKWRTCDDGLHPEDEECIDDGNNDDVPDWIETDFKGSDRIINGTVDMGAYENDPNC